MFGRKTIIISTQSYKSMLLVTIKLIIAIEKKGKPHTHKHALTQIYHRKHTLDVEKKNYNKAK